MAVSPPFFVPHNDPVRAPGIAQPNDDRRAGGSDASSGVMRSATPGIEKLRQAIAAKSVEASRSDASRVEAAEVAGVSPGARDTRRKPTNTELLEHATNTLDMAAGAAQAMGADDHADILRKAAKVGRTVPVAVAGIKREAAPVVEAAGGLWDAMERRGWVGVKEPVESLGGPVRKRTKGEAGK